MLLLNGKLLPKDLLEALNNELIWIENQISVMIDAIVNAMRDEVSKYIKPGEKEVLAQLNKEISKLNLRKSELLSSYFYATILPRVQSILKIPTLAQTEALCQMFHQDLLSSYVHATTQCFLYQHANDSARKIKENKGEVKLSQVVATAAERNVVNMVFSADGSEFVVINWAEGLRGNGLNASGDPDKIEVIAPWPQVVVRQEATVLGSGVHAGHALPYKSVKTDNIKLARAFFARFCDHQIEIHRQQLSVLSVQEEKQRSPKPGASSPALSKKAASEKIALHRMLLTIYEGFLSPSTSPSDQQLMILLNLCSHLDARADVVDDFLLARRRDVAENSKVIREALGHFILADGSSRTLNLHSFHKSKQEDILAAFSNFLEQQQCQPSLSAHLEGSLLVLENITLEELCGLLKSHEGIEGVYELIDDILQRQAELDVGQAVRI